MPLLPVRSTFLRERVQDRPSRPYEWGHLTQRDKPYLGIFIGWVALALVALSALSGEIVFTVAVIAISVVNYFLLSPSLWITSASPQYHILLIITIILVFAPLLCLALRRAGTIRLNHKSNP